MLLKDYIDSVYGSGRGSRGRFLNDNPDISVQKLNSWLRNELKIRPETGEVFSSVPLRIRVPTDIVSESGVYLSGDLRMRMLSLSAGKNLSTEAILNSLVAREELLHKLSGLQNSGASVTQEQQIADIVSRHFSSLPNNSSADTWRRMSGELVRELILSDLLSFYTDDIVESHPLSISRSAYYWYGGYVAGRVATMLGCVSIYLWDGATHPCSNVIFIGEFRNAVACYCICQQSCRLLEGVILNLCQTEKGSEIREESYQYVRHLAQVGMGSDIAISGDELNMARLRCYAEKNYGWAV